MNDTELAAIRRIVVQRLEDFQRGGLSHWKHIAPLVTEVPALAAAQSSPTTKTPVMPVTAAKQRSDDSLPPTTPIQVAAMPVQRQPGTSAAPTVAKSLTCAAFEPLNLAPEERVVRLAELAERVKACVRCQELATTRTQTVFGVGNPNARILFIGEAPGADEDKQGEPFVGKAGQLLNDIIKACRMKREDIYICNVLRCRPPGNRLPTIEEAGNCREFLDGQIAVVNPDYIVCWGSTAAKNLLDSEAPIGKMRGRFFQYGKAKVVCTYHPSYLLRNPAAKKDVWEDMKFLFRDMGIDLMAK